MPKYSKKKKIIRDKFRPSLYVVDLKKPLLEAPKRFTWPKKLRWNPKFIFWLIIIVLIFVSFIPIQEINRQVREAKEVVIASSLQALEHFQLASEGLTKLDFDRARQELEKANQSLTVAEKKLGTSFLLKIAQFLPFGADAFHFLRGSQYLAKAGQSLVGIIEILVSPVEVSLVPGDLIQPNQSADSLILPEKLTRINFLVTVSRLEECLEEAETKIRLANRQFNKVNSRIIPSEFRQQFEKIRTNLKNSEASIKNFTFLINQLDEVFGAKEFRRYLVVFQNNNEMRATGGFIGSFAVFDIDKGRIKRVILPAQGSYALQKYLKTNLASPRPLWPLKPHWQFHDANWFPDWPASARKLAWFYENSGGSTVDGVIAITADLVANLIDIVGPIETPEGITIDGANFISEVQKIVEIEAREKDQAPKQILVDLAPQVLEKIFSLPETRDEKKLVAILELLNRGLAQKQILFYFNNSEVQNWLTKENLVGQVRSTGKDYLYVNSSNGNGAKTEGVINQTVEHQAELTADGSIVDEVSIVRVHQGERGELFTGKESIDWLRIYVPKGSVLLEADGFEKVLASAFMKAEIGLLVQDKDLAEIEKEINLYESLGVRETQEFGKTCFGGWVQTKPGQTSTVKIKYRLPFSLEAQETSSYSLLVQKQPGMKPQEFSSKLILSKTPREIVWQYPDDESLNIDKKSIEFKTFLSQDKYWAVVIKN